MAEDSHMNPSFSASRRWALLLSMGISLVALLGLLAMTNYLGTGYFRRFPLAANSRWALAPQTVRLLGQLTNDVNITVYFDTEEDAELSSWVAGLLQEYQHRNKRIHVQTLDYARHPVEAALFLSKNRLSTQYRDFVLVESGGHAKPVFKNELADLDLNPLVRGESKEVKRTSFSGEMLFSSAILSVTHARPLKVYFLQGHGEHDPDEKKSGFGYAKFAQLLKDEISADWAKLTLGGTNEVPADGQLLVVAGPTKGRIAPQELTAIENYLNRGGRLLVLCNNLRTSPTDSGIETVLEKWGIAVQRSAVVDPDHTYSGNDLIPASVNPNHPVTKVMQAEGLQVQMVLPRSFEKIPPPPKSTDVPKVEALFQTSSNAIAKFFRGETLDKEAPEATGIFAVAVAAERGNLKGVTAERGMTRLIVVGDALCWDNEMLDAAANHYFANFAVNWLLSQPDILLEGLSPRPVKEYYLRATQREQKLLYGLFLAGLPGGILLFGALVWWRRRN